MDRAMSSTACLLMTTGQATVARSQTIVEANAARQSGLDVTVLAVTDNQRCATQSSSTLLLFIVII